MEIFRPHSPALARSLKHEPYANHRAAPGLKGYGTLDLERAKATWSFTDEGEGTSGRSPGSLWCLSIETLCLEMHQEGEVLISFLHLLAYLLKTPGRMGKKKKKTTHGEVRKKLGEDSLLEKKQQCHIKAAGRCDSLLFKEKTVR